MKTNCHNCNKTTHEASLSHNEVQGNLEMAYLHHVSSIVSSPINFSPYLQGKVLRMKLNFAEQARIFKSLKLPVKTSRFLARNPQTTPPERYISFLPGATTHPITLVVI